MILLNFSHPLTADHLAQVEALTGQAVARVIDVHVQVSPGPDLAKQIREIADATGLLPVEWQTEPLVVNLPGYAPAAAALVAELHGRMGHFPAILWLRPVANANPTRFEVAEVVDLQRMREQARLTRG
jgi:hypothetical protein